MSSVITLLCEERHPASIQADRCCLPQPAARMAWKNTPSKEGPLFPFSCLPETGGSHAFHNRRHHQRHPHGVHLRSGRLGSHPDFRRAQGHQLRPRLHAHGGDVRDLLGSTPDGAAPVPDPRHRRAGHVSSSATCSRTSSSSPSSRPKRTCASRSPSSSSPRACGTSWTTFRCSSSAPSTATIPDNPLRGKMLEFGDMMISVPKLWGFCAAIVTALMVYAFLQKTRMGRAVRATSLDRDAASLQGINQYKIYNVAFGIGTAVAGVAGVALVPFYNVFPSVGVLFDIKCFIIVVLGGLGSIGGALLGGMIVGVIESVGPQFMTATWTEAIVYGLFLRVSVSEAFGAFRRQVRLVMISPCGEISKIGRCRSNEGFYEPDAIPQVAVGAGRSGCLWLAAGGDESHLSSYPDPALPLRLSHHELEPGGRFCRGAAPRARDLRRNRRLHVHGPLAAVRDQPLDRHARRRPAVVRRRACLSGCPPSRCAAPISPWRPSPSPRASG